MDQRAPHRCQHGHLNGLGPQCYSRCLQVVEPAPAPKLEAAPVTPISAVTKNANASRKRGRPRVLSDEQRREKVRQRVAGWRAAKAGKVGRVMDQDKLVEMSHRAPGATPLRQSLRGASRYRESPP